jgi:hypothetical protein
MEPRITLAGTWTLFARLRDGPRIDLRQPVLNRGSALSPLLLGPFPCITTREGSKSFTTHQGGEGQG